MGLEVNPYGECPSEQLQSIGTLVSSDESTLVVATSEMMLMYGRELIESSKDSANCCNLGAVGLASST